MFKRLYQPFQPVLGYGIGVRARDDDDVAGDIAGAEVQGTAKGKLFRRDVYDARAFRAGNLDGVIRRTGIDDNDFERFQCLAGKTVEQLREVAGFIEATDDYRRFHLIYR